MWRKNINILFTLIPIFGVFSLVRYYEYHQKCQAARAFDAAVRGELPFETVVCHKNFYGFAARFIKNLDTPQQEDAEFLAELLKYRQFNYAWYLYQSVQSPEAILTPFNLVRPDEYFSSFFTIFKQPIEADYVTHPILNFRKIGHQEIVSPAGIEAIISDLP